MVNFAVAGESYDRFMGRYARKLAPRFAAFAGATGAPVLEVGCGPGALTAELAARHGADAVVAVDPSESFVAACRARVPGADVRVGGGEQLPFADKRFAAALSQLVLSFVRDADRVMAELSRVVRPGGTLAACTWSGEGLAVTRALWEAALRVDPAAPDDAVFPFRRMQELEDLFTRAGLDDVVTEVILVEERYDGFDDLWTPLTFGIGPTAWLAAQPPAKLAAIRDACFEVLGHPAGSFALPARALAVRGRVRPNGG